jgi:hypothetical protein
MDPILKFNLKNKSMIYKNYKIFLKLKRKAKLSLKFKSKDWISMYSLFKVQIVVNAKKTGLYLIAQSF